MEEAAREGTNESGSSFTARRRAVLDKSDIPGCVHAVSTTRPTGGLHVAGSTNRCPNLRE
jgi:hypothetical protein